MIIKIKEIKFVHGGGNCFCEKKIRDEVWQETIMYGMPNTADSVSYCEYFCCTDPAAISYTFQTSLYQFGVSDIKCKSVQFYADIYRNIFATPEYKKGE